MSFLQLGEYRLVVLDHRARLGEVRDVLTEPGEERPDPIRLERERGLERCFELLSGQEALNRSAGEAPARHVRREPGVLGAPQEKASQQPSRLWAGRGDGPKLGLLPLCPPPQRGASSRKYPQDGNRVAVQVMRDRYYRWQNKESARVRGRPQIAVRSSQPYQRPPPSAPRIKKPSPQRISPMTSTIQRM